jgi:hypothetical protein
MSARRVDAKAGSPFDLWHERPRGICPEPTADYRALLRARTSRLVLFRIGRAAVVPASVTVLVKAVPPESARTIA